jgi:hypothetical protein
MSRCLSKHLFLCVGPTTNITCYDILCNLPLHLHPPLSCTDIGFPDEVQLRRIDCTVKYFVKPEIFGVFMYLSPIRKILCNVMFIQQSLSSLRNIRLVCSIDALSRQRAGSKLRYSIASPSAPTSQVSEEQEHNSHGLRNKIEHLLRMKNPEAAERLLKKTHIDGSEFSWNLLIKYHARLGEYDKSNELYQMVYRVLAPLNVDEKVWCKANPRYLCPTRLCNWHNDIIKAP